MSNLSSEIEEKLQICKYFMKENYNQIIFGIVKI